MIKTIHPSHHLFIALCMCSAPAPRRALSLMAGAQQGPRQRLCPHGAAVVWEAGPGGRVWGREVWGWEDRGISTKT